VVASRGPTWDHEGPRRVFFGAVYAVTVTKRPGAGTYGGHHHAGVLNEAGTRNRAVTRGRVAFADAHLRGPLALRFAPNGDLLTANGDAVNADVLHPSEIVEFTTRGEFVREYNVDSSQGGAFGLDTLPEGAFNYAVIDDVTNSLSVARIPER
jgi:hypothetical protein